MATNLELKIKINSVDEILTKIKSNKIEHKNTLVQKDIYYNNENGLLKLRKVNKDFELIKYNRNEKKGERWSNYSVIKMSGENVEDFLNELFVVETIVEKVRELYLYKNTRIHLDNVKHLGIFLELETVVNEISKEEAINEFEEVKSFLDLKFKKQIKKSYRDLILLSK